MLFNNNDDTEINGWKEREQQEKNFWRLSFSQFNSLKRGKKRDSCVCTEEKREQREEAAARQNTW